MDFLSQSSSHKSAGSVGGFYVLTMIFKKALSCGRPNGLLSPPYSHSEPLYPVVAFCISHSKRLLLFSQQWWEHSKMNHFLLSCCLSRTLAFKSWAWTLFSIIFFCLMLWLSLSVWNCCLSFFKRLHVLFEILVLVSKKTCWKKKVNRVRVRGGCWQVPKWDY